MGTKFRNFCDDDYKLVIQATDAETETVCAWAGSHFLGYRQLLLRRNELSEI
jgi:hypothetical protein